MPHRRIAVTVAGLALAFTPSAAQAEFPDDRSFIVNAAHANVAEVAAGRLALRESNNDRVRAYARRMIADHSAAQAELRRIAREWNTSVPNQPSPVQRRAAERLAALDGAAFDRAYMRRQISDHRKALGVMLVEVDRGRVAALRAFAARTAVAVRMHLGMAKEVRATL